MANTVIDFVKEYNFIALVKQASPDKIGVGLSTPKQERLMARYPERLEVRLIRGV